MNKAELLEKVAMMLLSLAQERDRLLEENLQFKTAADKVEIVDGIGHLAPKGQNPGEWVDSMLSNGTPAKVLKQAAQLFPAFRENFAVASREGSNSDAMDDVKELVLGEV